MTDRQEKLLDLLTKFDEFCNQHDLGYYIVGGTLLGAVRHRGFIPWDDDVDVAMIEEDYQKLITLVSSCDGLFDVTSDEIHDYPFGFLKLYLKNLSQESFKYDAPYIDVFPLIYSIGYGKIAYSIYAFIRTITYVLQVKTGWCGYAPYKGLFHKMVYWFFSCFSISDLKEIRRYLISKLYDGKESKTICSPAGAYKPDKEFYPEYWFSRTISFEFEGHVFSGPTGWDEYLKQLYGNYMDLPPQNERTSKHIK